jgi:hypothetical protein
MAFTQKLINSYLIRPGSGSRSYPFPQDWLKGDKITGEEKLNKRAELNKVKAKFVTLLRNGLLHVVKNLIVATNRNV